MNKKIIVTGGAGFIGSNFIINFLKKKRENFEIINFDKLTYAGNLNNLKSVVDNPNYTFVKGDISNHEDVKKLFSDYKPDFVINFAAESHVDRSIDSASIFIDTNVKGTLNLLENSLKHKIKKFIQISTDEVYGSLGKTDSFREDSQIAPNNPYAASKASADLLVRSFHKTHKLPINITRCSNNYGPYQFPEKLIPLMINNIRKDKKLPIYGDGKNIRDWIYVIDHCEAIEKVLFEGINGEIYNIGSANEWENIKLVKELIKILKKDENLITFVKDRKGHDKRYAIDFTKIKNELGWTSQTNFAEGLRLTVDWYINNQDWLQNVINGDYAEYYSKMYKTD